MRISPHGRDVTQTTRQTFVAQRLGGMQSWKKMSALDHLVGRQQEFPAGRRMEDRGVISDAQAKRGSRRLIRVLEDFLYDGVFG